MSPLPPPLTNGPAPDAEMASDSNLLALLDLLGMPPHDRDHAARQPLVIRRVKARHALYQWGEPVRALAVVRHGSFKLCHMDESGYEQVSGLGMRGDVLGMESFDLPHHDSDAVALEDASVFLLPREQLAPLAMRMPVLAQALQQASSRRLRQSQALVDVLAAVASEVRLARFLLWHGRQMAEDGWSPRRLHLRMGRRDLASLLGVAHETVSRSFTALSLAGLIAVNDRDIEILDPLRLQAYARSTRRPQDDARCGTAPRAASPMRSTTSTGRRSMYLT